MKLFVDTGSVKDIEALAAIGILDGVTTNPTLLSKEGGDYRQILKRICDIVKGPVSGEVVATDYAGMVREGRDIASIDEHMIVKVPLTKDGVKACKTPQAWLAAKAGASYVSPFVGRLDDIGNQGMQIVREIVDLFDNADYPTEILVASVRHPIHIIEAARLGADIVTVPPAVVESCFKHPLTDVGLERFLKDWEKAQGAKV
jgi:transaldolase